MILGTDVNVETCKENFQRFLQCFTDPLAKEEDNVGIDITQPLYMQQLGEVIKYDLQVKVLVFEII